MKRKTATGVSLMFNVYEHTDNVYKILDALDEYEAKSTFFIGGSWADDNVDCVREIYKRGHEIASHSNTHPHVNNLSYEQNVKEIREANEKIKAITGNENKIYRAPYGEYNNTVVKAVQDEKNYCIQWNLDTIDYTGLSGDQMWDRLKNKIKEGDIILSHNGTKHTAESLDMLIKNIKAKGLEVVTISDLIYKENYTINANGTQISNSTGQQNQN